MPPRKPTPNLIVHPSFSEALNRGYNNIPQWSQDFLDIELHAGEVRWLTESIDVPERCGTFAKRWGKLLALDTPLPTADGWTTMGEVQVGDLLFDEAGQPCQVTLVTPVEVGRPTYEMMFSDGSVIVAGGEHLWLTWDFKARRRAEYARKVGKPINRGPEVRDTDTIRATLRGPDGWYNYSVQTAQPIQLPRRPLPVDPYVLGAWLGDGSSNTSDLTGMDPEIFAEVAAAGYSIGPNKCVASSRCPTHKIGKEQGLTHSLNELGVLRNKYIPTDYLRASPAQRLALLQGLMDTDGSVMEGGHCEFMVTSRQLSDGAFELLCSLGMKPTFKEERATLYGKDCGPRYRISFTPELPVFRLERKLVVQQETANHGPSLRHRYVVDVRPVPSMPMRCIQVDSPNHLYLCGRTFIPTHNTLCEGVRILHKAFYRETDWPDDPQGNPREFMVVNVAMSLDQASLAWNMAHTYASNSKRFRKFLRDDQTRTAPFPQMVIGTVDGKRTTTIWARSTAKRAKYLLGHQFDHIGYDEPAHDADFQYVHDEVLLSRVASVAGQIEMYSSPNGQNAFYRLCMRAETEPEHLFWMSGSVYDNTFIPHERFRRQEQIFTPDQVKQDIYGLFAEMSTIFAPASVGRCYAGQNWLHLLREERAAGVAGLKADHVLTEIDQRPEPIWRSTLDLRPGGRHAHRYVMGVDLARKRDKTVIIVLDVTDLSHDQDGELQGSCHIASYKELVRTDWKTVQNAIHAAAIQYHHCPVMVDATGAGDPIFSALQEEPYRLDVTGFIFGAKSKENLILQLQRAIQNTQIRFPFIQSLVESLTYYEWDDRRIKNTDPLMALGLALEQAKRGAGRGPATVSMPELAIHRVRSPFAPMTDDERWDAETDAQRDILDRLVRY